MVVRVLIILLLLFLLMRMNKAGSSTAEANEPIEELDSRCEYENDSDMKLVSAERTEEPEEQEEIFSHLSSL
ncbi:hypothetical protein NQZ68_013515 [Dissostichus eleginoides]|nr:hypothetical protein NQZ68_013515 [Dissostichus eleginoides]